MGDLKSPSLSFFLSYTLSLSFCLPIYPSIYLSIYLFIYEEVYWWVLKSAIWYILRSNRVKVSPIGKEVVFLYCSLQSNSTVGPNPLSSIYVVGRLPNV